MTKTKEKIWKGNVRDATLSILLAVENNQAYSNLLLHQTIEKYTIPDKDRALLTELTYGCIQRKMTLDYFLHPFIHKKIDNWVRLLLHLSVYQLVFLDRIPNHAIVNEAVEIAKKRGHKGIAGLVNGVLRSIMRDGVQDLSQIANPIQRLAIETSHPEWLIARWVEQFGIEKTKQMTETNNLPPIQTIRVNTQLSTVEEVMNMFEQQGIEVERSQFVPECLLVKKGSVGNTDIFKNGFVTIQDESSMIPTMLLDVQPGQVVLDMCAAPGGKSTHIAEKLSSKGKLISVDLHPHKVKLIDEQVTRLRLTNVETMATDSKQLANILTKQSFDRILVDAPCSGLGVIRRKPDIKYTKKEQDFSSLHNTQLQLLDQAYELLKQDGKLVYSTCTIEKKENNETVQAFLQNHSDIELVKESTLQNNLRDFYNDGMMQLFPQDLNSDGFFIAVFRKKGAQ